MNIDLETHGYSQFRTQCKCMGKVCKMVISSSSFFNFVLVEMVEKLNLQQLVHRRPYMAQGLHDRHQVEVRRKVYVPFNIGTYEDSILCDVIPLVGCHLILGRAWKVEKHTLYDGALNSYTFNHGGRQVILRSLKEDEASWRMPTSFLFERVRFLRQREKEEDKVDRKITIGLVHQAYVEAQGFMDQTKIL